MPKKSSRIERKIKTKNTYIEGSPKLEDGDLVGGNKIVVNSSDTTQLLEILSKSVTLEYQSPSKFAGALRDLRGYHQSLLEWKELHDGLDDILNAFSLFHSYIYRLNSRPQKPNLKNEHLLQELGIQWRPTSKRVSLLLEFSRDIKLIGKPFTETGGEVSGEPWAIEFYWLRFNIEFIVFPNEDTVTTFREEPSWHKLYDLTGSFYDTTLTRLHWADKSLRECANNLYFLSERLFQR